MTDQILQFKVTYLNSKAASICVTIFPNIQGLKYSIGNNIQFYSQEEFNAFLSPLKFFRKDVLYIKVLNEKTGKKEIFEKDFSANWPVDYDDTRASRKESYKIPKSLE